MRKAAGIGSLVVLLTVVVCAQAPVPSDPALGERARQELLHAWKGYKQYASGHDELQPLTKAA